MDTEERAAVQHVIDVINAADLQTKRNVWMSRRLTSLINDNNKDYLKLDTPSCNLNKKQERLVRSLSEMKHKVRMYERERWVVSAGAMAVLFGALHIVLAGTWGSQEKQQMTRMV